MRIDSSVEDGTLRTHDLEIDTAARVVRRRGRHVRLTPREYDLLEFLARHRGRVVSRAVIWNNLYNEYDTGTSNVIDVYIRYLRRKIDEGFETPLILTRRGAGYMLRGDEP
jgi:DNA-binding response OmpR family regulator